MDSIKVWNLHLSSPLLSSTLLYSTLTLPSSSSSSSAKKYVSIEYLPYSQLILV